MGTREKAIRHGDQRGGHTAWGPERRYKAWGPDKAIRHGDQRGNKAWGPERRH